MASSKDPKRRALPKSPAKQKRQLREKARRQRLIRKAPPGAKEKFVSGCIVVGATGFILLVSFLTWTCFFGEK